MAFVNGANEKPILWITTSWQRFNLTSAESQPQHVMHMVGTTMDVSERYFVAAATTIFLVLLGVGLLASV
jgi:hypothetical protein